MNRADYDKEISKLEAESLKMEEENPLAKYSTSQLKEELRRRKREGLKYV